MKNIPFYRLVTDNASITRATDFPITDSLSFLTHAPSTETKSNEKEIDFAFNTFGCLQIIDHFIIGKEEHFSLCT